MHRGLSFALVAVVVTGWLMVDSPPAPARVFPLSDVVTLSTAEDVFVGALDVVATDSGFLAAWKAGFLDDRIQTACFDARGRFLRGPSIDSVTSSSVDSGSLVMASDRGGHVILAWGEHDTLSYVPRDVVVAKLSTSCGVPSSVTTLSESGSSPRVAMSENGAFLATWGVESAEGTSWYGRFFDAAGDTLGDDRVLVDASDAVARWTDGVEVANVEPDEYVLVWSRWEAASTGYSYVGREVSAISGTSSVFPLVGAHELPDYSSGSRGSRPALVAEGRGRMLLVWTESLRPSEWWWQNRRFDVFARYFSKSGTPLGSRLQLTDAASTSINDYREPAAAVDSTGFVVSWTSHYTTPFGSRIAAHEDGTFTILWRGWADDYTGAHARVFCDDAGTNLACGTTRCQTVTRDDQAMTLPTAHDALVVLRGALGLAPCAHCVCDVDASESITASDASRVLRHALGGDIALTCSACAQSARHLGER